MHGVGRGLALPEQVLRAVAAAAVAERKAAAAALAERIVGVFAMSRGNDEAILVVGDGEVPVHLLRLRRGQAGLLEDRIDRKSTRLNSRHYCASRMPSPARKKKL